MNLQRRWTEISLKRIIPTILDICTVKKEREMTIKVGTALKLLTNKHQDKVNIKVVLLKHSVMRTWDNFFQDMDWVQATWKLFLIRKKKIYTRLHAWDYSKLLIKDLLLKMLEIIQMHIWIQVFNIRKILKRKTSHKHHQHQ
jgi:hypothetical protein